ncbi:MAG TPA: sugar ABC transporter substrate-binding protein [Bacillus sp. (in: firmicutes)]|nr:sugar ABC transporter substrate-binding protein [Bacillus sp. (in: firmicutes)]
MVKKFMSLSMVVLLFFLAACSSNSTSGDDQNQSDSGKDGERVTITWWDYNAPEATQQAIADTIAAYEKEHPNVKIERTYVPFADLKKKLLMGTAAGQLPDIVAIDNADHQAFSAAGVFADITKEVEEWGEADQYFDGPWSSTTYKGKNYGVPNSSNNLALYYNADMLKEAGIEPPKNWEELAAAAKKLTKDGVYGMAVSGVKTEQGSFQFLPFVWQAGSDLDNFNSQGTIDAIKLWKKMVDNGSMSKEVISQDQEAIAVQFAAGKVAMMVNGTWQIPFLEKEAKVNWSVANLPAEKESGTILGGENWAITASTKHKDVAWDIIKFIQKEEHLKKYLQTAGRLPSRKDVIQDPFWQDDQHLKTFADGMEVAKARAYGPDYPKMSEAIQEMIQQVLTGEKSPEDAVKEADEKIKPLLK